MDSKEFCKLCLVTDVKLFCLSIPCLSEAYLQLLKIPSVTPQGYACYECAGLLMKYKDFHTKCNNAHILLSYLQPDHTKITKQMVQLLDRKLHKLESRLEKTNIHVEFSQIISHQPADADIEEKLLAYEIKTEVNEDDYVSITNGLSEAVVIEKPVDTDTAKKKVKKRKKTTEAIKNKVTTKRKKRKPSSDELSIKDENSFDNNDSLSDIDDIPLSEVCKSEDVPNTEKKLKEKEDSNLQNGAVERNKKGEIKKSPGWRFNIAFYKDYATVITMTKEEAKKEMLLRKESSNYKNCMFKCELCFRGYDTKVTYENHMKKHKVEYGAFECEICHLRFSTKFVMWQHQTSCHKRKFLCKICSYTCFCSQQARAHINRHKGKTYTCKDCGEVFSMHNSLLMHQRIKHKAEIVCDICGSVFVVERGLKSHRRLLHTQEKNEGKGPKCSECNIQFSTEMAWKRHLVLSTKHKVSNGCEHCGETFPDEKTLRTHAKQHSRVYKQNDKSSSGTALVELPAACTMCDLWITTRSMYKAHMTSQHPEAAAKVDNDVSKECMCEVCGKVFKKQCFLSYHLRTHTGERPHQCLSCGRGYTTPSALRAHRLQHSPRAPAAQPCHLCHKVLHSRSALNKHVKVAHLNIRPHKCAICEKTFPNPCEVKNHMKHVHFKVPWPKRDRSKRPKESTA